MNMYDLSLKLNERVSDGQKLSKLRSKGFIPSIVYGGQIEPILTQSLTPETIKLVKAAGKHTPINLIIDGKKKLAIIKSVDVNPVNHSIVHVAFHAIKQDDVITAEVPIVLIGEGESAAEKAGLVVLQAIEKIEVKAKPADLPESLEVSILELTTDDDKLTIGDIKLPTGVEFADADQDMELAIASVYEPGALQAANESAGGDENADVSDVEVESGGIEESANESQSR